MRAVCCINVFQLLHKSALLLGLQPGGHFRHHARSSGTEPKIKWYSEILSNDADAREILVEVVDTAVQELMQPKHFGFEMRKF